MQLTAQITLSSRVPFLEKLLFTKHFSVMITSGIPISEAIGILIRQTRNNNFKKVLKDILDKVNNGQTLHKSMAAYPKVFDQFYQSMIEVAEESGNLDTNLSFLSQQLTKEQSVKRKVKSALLYPIIIFSAAIIVGGFVSFFILPQLIDFFDTLNVELPVATKVMLFVATSLRDYGLLIMVTIIGLMLATYFLLKNKVLRKRWHQAKLKLPLFGTLLIQSQLSSFSRNFSTLLKSGIPIPRSLEITASTLSNLKIQEDLQKTVQGLSKGKAISASLQEYSGTTFPPLVMEMINIGEKTGKLEDTLTYLASYFDEEIDELSRNLTTMLEPVMLLFIGVIVAFLALAIIGPIYELTGNI